MLQAVIKMLNMLKTVRHAKDFSFVKEGVKDVKM